MNGQNFYGVLTAMVTPISKGEVDWKSLKRNTEWQIEQGIQGLVAVGTTGESPTLKHSQHRDVFHAVKEASAGRVPIVAGTGSNSTHEAIQLTKQAHDAGVDAMLVVAPYYNKPNQEGLFQHISAIAECTDKPIILYSIPSRCGIEFSIPTIVRLREKYAHINVIKESGGSCARVCEIRQALGDDITILSGDDGLTIPFMSVGAKGVISVASNLVPKAVVDMVKLALDNDFERAMKLQEILYPLFINIFVEPNPVPMKYAMMKAGLIESDEVYSPLVGLSDENKLMIDATVETLNQKLPQ